ncbi:AlpA family transcriptional regulator [Rhizobium sp. BK661]|uniref:helix-turn-helix transcriptional regulator n=1 Tax=Rhizobium sp. BK661 TaxID=2586991 RepID=UPI0021689935|nr:hypothetical protein [Rhizobium sp. BK661]MCS3744316.1 putative DNA-binding transcriptional regulator AlpA [Rhizobium sp. BK661]
MRNFYQIIRPARLAKILDCSERTVWREVKMGRIPPPIQITPGVVGWSDTTVEQILEDRIAGRMVTLMPKPATEMATEKRGPGRPKKTPRTLAGLEADETPKRGGGRPRKSPEEHL